MKNNLFRNWTISRVIRLVIAGVLIYQAWFSGEIALGLIGVFIASMALFNYGCCANNSCSIPQKKDSKYIENVQYEEIH